MRLRRPLAAILLLVLALAGCSGGEEEQQDTAASEGAAAETADLPDGVAAKVGDEEIQASRIDGLVEAAVEGNQQLADALEGEQGDAVRQQVEARLLSQLIVTEIILGSAEEMEIEVDEAQIEEKRSELATEAGGEEAFQEQIDQAGLTDEQLLRELEGAAVLDEVRLELTGETEAPTEQPTPGASPDPVQQWLVQQVTEADVTVDEDYGRWDPNAGAVVPPTPVAPPTGTETSPPTETTSPEGE